MKKINFYEVAREHRSNYIGSSYAWKLVWDNLADVLNISLEHVPVFEDDGWLNQLNKYSKDIPKSLYDFVISNGINIFQEIIILSNVGWFKNYPSFFYRNVNVVMGEGFDDKNWGLNNYILDMSNILSKEDSEIKIFFDFDKGENISNIPIEYFEVMRKSLAFAENILGNGELFWISPALNYADGEWDICGYYPSDCSFIRFDNMASFIFYVLKMINLDKKNYNLIADIEKIFSQYLVHE